MTESLDLADARARFAADKGMGYEARCDTIRLCDELERLRLRETTLWFTLDTERGENERLRAENLELHKKIEASDAK